MDSEEFSYEVPIVNSVEVTFVGSKSVETEDCYIIPPKKGRKNRLNVKDCSNQKNTIAAITIDEDDNNDCTIIEDQSDLVDVQTTFINKSNNISEKSQESSSYHRSTNQSKNLENNIDDSTIDLDDSDQENDCSIIDNNITSEKICSKSTSSKSSTVAHFDEIYKENKVFAEVLEKCLDMENSTGMLRIINRTIVPIYNDASDNFKQSNSFQRLLAKTLVKLDTVPNRKFMHLREMCEVMKAGLSIQKPPVRNLYKKKKMQLTTLKRNLNGKFSTNKMTSSDGNIPKKKTKIDVIDVDDDEVIISMNETDIQISDVRCQTFEETCQIPNLCMHHVEETNKEVVSESNNNNENRERECEIVLVDDKNPNSNNDNITDSALKSKNTTCNAPVAELAGNSLNGLLCKLNAIDIYNNDYKQIELVNKNCKPKEAQTATMHVMQDDAVIKRIKILEAQIKIYNQVVENLEMEEVDWEATDRYSPYVESEVYKRKILSLYKELCQLTGTEAVKRHKVRLKVAEGHAEGPVRCLEQFVNDNIDVEGNPPFPDMMDVTQCVIRADELYGLGWSKKEIEQEARALFIHYGRTVQKTRQKREWRHLMRYVKEEVADPADEDPELQARLEANAQVAVKNEMELLDRYALIEGSTSNSIARICIDSSDSEHESGSDEISTALSKTVFQSETERNYQDLPNNSTNKESNSNQTTDNVVINNLNPEFTPLVPIVAENPTKYIFIDGDMRHLSIVTKPLPSCGTLRNIEFNHIFKDLSKGPNAINTVESIVEKCIAQDNQELDLNRQVDTNSEKTENARIENNANTVSNISTRIIKDSFANAEAYIEENIKPSVSDVEDSISIQYNEITTNSNVDTNTDIVGDKYGIENNGVSSSSEVCAYAGEVVNNSVSSETEDKRCELVSVKRLSDNIDKTNELGNEAESTKDRDKIRELVNDPESTQNVDKASRIVNNARPPEIENEISGHVNATRSSDNTCSLGYGTESAKNGEKPCTFKNDAETEARDKTCKFVNDTGSNTDLNEIIVKKEKEDTPRMLEALGDNFTVTIIAIEDPFEVIEISDSSDSEDE